MKTESHLIINSGFTSGVKAWKRAFTLIELLVVVAIIAILAAVLLPVLHQAQLRGQTASCIANQKQMDAAWIMYASDNNDACAGNNWPNEQVWQPKTTWFQNWVSGWIGADGSGGNGLGGGVGGPDNTNSLLLVNSRFSTLADYTRVSKLYLCPASIVLGPVTGTGPPNPGPPYYPICRTVSMNCYVGYNCVPPGANNAPYAAGTSPTPDYSGLIFKVFAKVTDMKAGASPSDMYVFIEERPESIDDGSFATYEPGTGQSTTTYFNIPTDYHNGSATVAFGDGHVEVHRWHDSNLLLPQTQIVQRKWQGITVNNPGDYYWLANHASVLK